ncbi:hypothetical protein BJ138DRAFT_1002147 [Hygrophoropsis aurantiaca]|uniref:Uncharacterized protein n=1 Tax=Hygrophoropsis aurantiaca TaxID=72124 RepID=A0ACB8AJJ0_9AGAM|nr:hypothetical protein BJ138DRAFT_1002147 [Hygrophoropsis aurantiaca]
MLFDKDSTNVQSPTTGGDSPSSSDFVKNSDTKSNVRSSGRRVIPHEHSNRTLVLCFDGTGDQYDVDNSNIVQFFSMLKKGHKKEQMVYYQAGIGTYTIPEIATPLMAKLSKTIDMMIGIHLDAHVMGGYEFLMENYEEGDKICIFGFSRGAYTARALAGMLHKVGLLPMRNHQQVPFAYHMYCKDDTKGWELSDGFKSTFSIDVQVEFLGVWDTVSAVGVLPKNLPFTRCVRNIRHFRQALSLDEHRVRFKPVPWTQLEDKVVTKGTDCNPPETEGMTVVDEVWFAGCHTDVGGGSVPNGTRHSLARIPLRWMIRQCFMANTGILFYHDMFERIGMDPDSLHPHIKQRPPPLFQDPSLPRERPPNDPLCDPKENAAFVSEEEEDLNDALRPVYDQLSLSKGWWILETTPQKQYSQEGKRGSWIGNWRFYRINLGKGRHVPRQNARGIKVHRTVKIRMEADGFIPGKYWPKAKLKVEPEWVD